MSLVALGSLFQSDGAAEVKALSATSFLSFIPLQTLFLFFVVVFVIAVAYDHDDYVTCAYLFIKSRDEPKCIGRSPHRVNNNV